MPPGAPLTFAAVGDVHGQMHAMVRLLQQRERRLRRKLAFVLQVGDFEPHRSEADLATMAAPAKYRQLGEFPEYHAGRAAFPWPIHFIGGNHEPYGFLDTLPNGGLVAPACHYLGRVGVIEVNGLRVVGLSGIHDEDHYRLTRPSIAALDTVSNRDFTFFTEDEVLRAAELGPADVLLLHEWPAGIFDSIATPHLGSRRRASGSRPVGSDPARLLVELLAPRLVLTGHMHWRHRASIPTGSAVAEVCCLASLHEKDEAIAIFERRDDGTLHELD